MKDNSNIFPEVEVYRYVTEQTFDAYLYQLVESKQKFISQIMTSKSPVRSAEDVDEVALSFAEVKMLATGDERFKEKMDLDIQVSKLRVLKQSYLSEHYDLEDRIIKYFPREIKEYEERIVGYESDTALVMQHQPQGEDKICPMTLKGLTYTEKADAGQMLLAVCKENISSQPVAIGSYRGFKMEVYYDSLYTEYRLNLCGKAKHQITLGSDALGNLTRIENELSKLPAKLEADKTKLVETISQLENAKIKMDKVDVAGFGAVAQAIYNPKTDEHILRICINLELKKYIVFHEFTHILDADMYASKDSLKYMYLSGYTEYHASQVELMVLLGVDSIHSMKFAFSLNSQIETFPLGKSIEEYLCVKHQFVVDMMSRTDFPANIEALKTTLGALYNYFGLRSICKMYAHNYVEQVDNTAIIKILPLQLFTVMNIFMEGWFDKSKVEMSFAPYSNAIMPLIKEYKLL